MIDRHSDWAILPTHNEGCGTYGVPHAKAAHKRAGGACILRFGRATNLNGPNCLYRQPETAGGPISNHARRIASVRKSWRREADHD